jgi:hypothetical protein
MLTTSEMANDARLCSNVNRTPLTIADIFSFQFESNSVENRVLGEMYKCKILTHFFVFVSWLVPIEAPQKFSGFVLAINIDLTLRGT